MFMPMTHTLLKCKARLQGEQPQKLQVFYALPLNHAYRVVLQWHETGDPERWIDLPKHQFEAVRGFRGQPELLLKTPLPSRTSRQAAGALHAAYDAAA
jgi:hypothetical protein